MTQASRHRYRKIRLMEDTGAMRPAMPHTVVVRPSLIGLLLCALLLASTVLAAPRHPRPRNLPRNRGQLQQRKAILKSKITQVRKQIRLVKYREQQTRVHLKGVDQRLTVARGQLQYAALMVKRTQIELHRAGLALSDAKHNFANAQHDARDRLVTIYEHGDEGYMHLLLAADNYGDMLQRAQFARFLMAQDRAMLENLKSREQRVTNYQQNVRTKTAETTEWKARVAILNQRIVREHVVVSKNLNVAQQERVGLEAELDALERDSSAVQSMLRSLQTTTAGRRRFSVRYAVGGLPVAGRITSGFGYRYHPLLHTRRLHTGVDIAAPIGTPIFAAGSGTVIWAGRRGGYGNAVIIDHGGGKATLYGHMSSFCVSSGQTIAGRQMIGRVGSTGMSTGPHCHYEVRINGVPVNPL